MFHSNMVKKAQKGDEQAFINLIHKEKEKLYRVAFMYVKNENDALEIVQETIYKAYTAIKKVKEATYFSTWLTRILINTALDYIKGKNKIIPFENDTLEKIEFSQNLIAEDKLDLLHAIELLDEKYKTVIVLRYYKDYSVKQIADLLECPEGTVKTNLHRAVIKLRMNFQEELKSE